jgi:predicted anti-sigma-YlaC factor YlaD
MTSECNKLDAYLADDLPSGAATQYVQHLEQCESCREAVAQQRWVDDLLRSREIASLEPLPSELRNTLRKSITQRRRTARRFACSLAAAATVAIVAIGWTLQSTHLDNSRGLDRNRIAVHVASTSPDPRNPTLPRATFVSNGDTIVVPIESTHNDVTIVRLYPTTETERRTRRELALQLIYSESNGG